MKGNKPEFRLTAQAKRYALLAFVAASAIFILDRLNILDVAFGQAGARRAARQTQSNLMATDCSYVQSPESYEGVALRHRRAVSQITETVAARFNSEGLRLSRAQDIPRKNVVDQFIFNKMQQDGIASAPLCTDEEFIRRVYLDLTGRIPSISDVTRFLEDQEPFKRDILVDSLIESPEFVDKWAMFFSDLYRLNSNNNNIQRGINGNEAFHKWLRESLAQNKSYAQMATEMIAARGDSYVDGPSNFIAGGFVTGGPAQDTYDGLAVQVGTIFLGLSSMDCLLCHDGAGHLDAINVWGGKATRLEAWGLAAFFARHRRAGITVATNVQKYNVTEATTGEYDLNTTNGNRQNRTPIGNQRSVPPKYMFGNGTVANGEDRRRALARHLTEDPQFARAAVNYLWEEMMVEALVSPSNAFDLARLDPNAQMPEGWSLQPNNAELLRALAEEFSSSGFNLRHVIKLIAQSSTYQLSSKYPGAWKLEYVPYYARKFVRRLDAEEIHDAVVKATNMPPVTNPAVVNNVTVTPRMIGFPIIDEMGNKLREVQWAMQLPEPREPRFGQANGGGGGFLNTFLRGNRDSNLRQGDSSILQALSMMNNEFIRQRAVYQATGNTTTNTVSYIDPIPGYNTQRISSTLKRLIETPGMTNEEIVMELYLNTLSRYPTSQELEKIKPYFSSMTRNQALESVQWVLFNKVDFLFNY